VVLWGAFVVVHAALIGIGLFNRGASGDVWQMYRGWAASALSGAGVPGVTEPWVYPPAALVPILIAGLMHAFAGYTVSWGVLVTAIDALAFAVLVGRARSRGRRDAAWFWLVASLALGGVGMFRLDAITVPIAVAGGLWLAGRPWLGSALLVLATWVKVWPAAMVAAAVIAVRRRGAVLGAAVMVSAAIVLLVAALGGAPHMLSFVTEQTARSLQIEAPISMPYVWLAAFGIAGASTYFNHDIITIEVTGPFIDAVVWAMTPAMAMAMLAIVLLGGFKAWRGVGFATLFPTLSLALVLAFIVFNKVVSPQYMIWLVPPLVIGLAISRRRWRAPAIAVVGILGMTQAIFPWFYTALLALHPVMVVALTLRNVLLIVLLAWMVIRIAQARSCARRRSSTAQPTHSPDDY
jgi:hypothetical protein